MDTSWKDNVPVNSGAVRPVERQFARTLSGMQTQPVRSDGQVPMTGSPGFQPPKAA